MAGNVAALLAGFDYQWLYGWYRALELLAHSGRLESISIEDPTAGFFDDVTLRPRAGTAHVPAFVQVKFHAEQNAAYSALSANWLKLLSKAWRTWLDLRAEQPNLELHLVTTWAWDWQDPVRIGDGRFVSDFVDGSTSDQRALEARQRWKVELGDPAEDDLVPFLRSMRMKPSYSDWSELVDHAIERMGWSGLKTDDDAIRKGMDIVRGWVKARRTRVNRDDLLEAIDNAGLNEVAVEPSVVLYLHTIRKARFDVGADYELDWRDAFDGSEQERGHRTLQPGDWNDRLLLELEAMEARIESETSARLLRVRGMARLSIWFAVGYVFRGTAGWTIETEQWGNLWRTDESPSGGAPSFTAHDLPGDQGVLALAIGVTGDPTAQAETYLASISNPAGRLMTILTPRLGPDAIPSAGELSRLAGTVKTSLQSLNPRPSRASVFYWGPSSGATFVGHALNATVREIQLHEDDHGSYLPSILLR